MQDAGVTVVFFSRELARTNHKRKPSCWIKQVSDHDEFAEQDPVCRDLNA